MMTSQDECFIGFRNFSVPFVTAIEKKLVVVCIDGRWKRLMGSKLGDWASAFPALLTGPLGKRGILVLVIAADDVDDSRLVDVLTDQISNEAGEELFPQYDPFGTL